MPYGGLVSFGSRQTEMPECVVKLISAHRDASCQHVLVLFA
jgi:hypothetical protein